MNSWIGLTVPVVMYVIVKFLVSKEDEYLEQEFGEEYRVYKKQVPAILPLGWLKRR
jgi:protein-S-isoprenylcysteine O-methyltransferase Ste14